MVLLESAGKTAIEWLGVTVSSADKELVVQKVLTYSIVSAQNVKLGIQA